MAIPSSITKLGVNIYIQT